MVLNKLKLSVKCDYNDNKQILECSRHIQYKVITFCDNNTKVCDNNHDLTLNYGTNEPLVIWWKDGPEKIEIVLFFMFEGPEIIKFIDFIV